MKSRRAIICLSIVSLSLCLLMGTMWVRSHDTADRIHGRLWGKRSFVVASKQGRLTIVGFLWHGASNAWVWQMRRYPASDVMSFPVGDMRQYEKGLGFGIIRQPIYFVMHPTQETPQGTISLLGAASATLRGSGVIVPYWFLMLMTVIVSGLILLAMASHNHRIQPDSLNARG